jgi:hypothetical protein
MAIIISKIFCVAAQNLANQVAGTSALSDCHHDDLESV